MPMSKNQMADVLIYSETVTEEWNSCQRIYKDFKMILRKDRIRK